MIKRLVSIIEHFDLLKNNPLLFSRIMKAYFRLLILRRKVMRKVDIALTFNCNAKCSHCFSAKLQDKEKRQLTLKELKDCIKQSLSLGAIAFEFTGGEPLLSEHLCEAVRSVKTAGVIAGVTTNGLLVTKQLVRELKKVRLDVAQISLDSASPNEHDKSRGVSDSYERAIRAIELFKTARIKVMLSTVVTNQNVVNKDILEVIQLARKLDVLITLNPACKAGSWSCENEVSLSNENQRIYQKLMDSPYARWAGYMNFLKENCPCGKESIFITAYGDVLPCGFIQISYGNIREDSLEDIFNKMHALPLESSRPNVCAAGLDEGFIATYLEPLNKEPQLPITIDKLLISQNAGLMQGQQKLQ